MVKRFVEHLARLDPETLLNSYNAQYQYDSAAGEYR